LFSSNLSLCYSVNVRDQVSNPYRTTSKIIVLHILIFTFFDSRCEDRRLWTENGSKHNQNSIFSKFHPESNFDLLLSSPNIWTVTFSNELFAIFMSNSWPAFWWQDIEYVLVIWGRLKFYKKKHGKW
jgi:hypothetical protein